jgi:hypothetical protein
MPISQVAIWKNYFLQSKHLEYSNTLAKEIRDSFCSSTDLTESIHEISKNEGITFLSLDASEENLQLFHHPTIIGGSWI